MRLSSDIVEEGFHASRISGIFYYVIHPVGSLSLSFVFPAAGWVLQERLDVEILVFHAFCPYHNQVTVIRFNTEFTLRIRESPFPSSLDADFCIEEQGLPPSFSTPFTSNVLPLCLKRQNPPDGLCG